MATTIAFGPATRDRLRAFGTAGMSYDRILVRLMDEVDRERFIAELHRRADEVRDWVPLEDA